ncbi:MAG: hypothetical protein Q9182_002841 [Xanthomendoza sp. 2 TL-2023]
MEPMGRVSPFSWLRGRLSTYAGAATLPQLFAGNLTQAYFAHYYTVPEMMAVAQVRYGKHLLMLRKLLGSPSIVNTDQLVQGIMLLLLFEMLSPTSSAAWSMHTSALANIIENLGPDQCQSIADVSGQNMCRALILLHLLQLGHAMQLRKRTFLEAPKWRKFGTWLMEDRFIGRFMDAHELLPGLLEDFDSLCSSNASPKVCFEKLGLLKHRTIGLINLHLTWRWEWERRYGDQVWAVPCPPTSHVPRDEFTGDPLYPTLFRFSMYNHSAVIGRYNSTLATVFHLAHDIWGDHSYLNLLDRSIRPDMMHRARRSPLCLPSDPGFGLRTAAAEHIRSIEMALSQEINLSSGGLILLTSVSNTYKLLSVGDPLRDWIRRMCGRSEKVGEAEMMRDWKLEPGHWKRYFVEA